MLYIALLSVILHSVGLLITVMFSVAMMSVIRLGVVMLNVFARLKVVCHCHNFLLGGGLIYCNQKQLGCI
jgi:hypothetical protein